MSRAASRLTLTLALAVAGCGPVDAVDRDERFELTVSSPRSDWAVGEPVEVRGRLAFLGPEPLVRLRASGSGLLIWSVEQLDGPLDVGGGATDDCAPYEIRPGAPVEVAYAKSGGFGADDPNAPLLRAFLDDPVLRFPAGRYRVTARATFYEDECGGDAHDLAASVVIRVGGGSGQPLDP